MSLNTVTLTWNFVDLVQSGESATLTIGPTAQLVDSTDGEIVAAASRSVAFTGGTGRLAGIVANDNAAIQPQGQGYTITVTTASGQVIYSQTVAIDYANGAIQDLSTLTPASAAALNLYLQLPGGTPTAGSAPVATGSGTATSWQKILQAASNLSDVGSAATARTNLGLGSAATAALSSLLQAANNLSDLGSAATARGNLGLGSAALLASSAVLQAANNLSDLQSASVARGNLGLGSAALLAASAVLQAANNLSDLASPSTARSNLGLGSAALLASSAVLQAANNLSDLASAATARTNLGLGSAATQPNSAFDAAGAAAAAQAASVPASVMTTLGDTLYGGSGGAATRLAGQTTATRKFLRQTGTGTASAAPAWDTLQAGDLPAATTGAQGAVVLPAASVNYKPANPAGTVSTTLVMMGLGATCVFTPSGTGKVRIDVRAEWYVNTAATNVTIGARYGTGTAPANAATVTGTRFGAPADSTVRGSGSAGTNNAAVIPWTDILTLTPATAYWFDLALAAGNASDQANLQNISVTIQELIA